MKTFLLYISIMILHPTILMAASMPILKKGVVDLSNWNFEQRPVIEIRGEAEFYWHKMLTPENIDSVKEAHYLTIPSSWHSINDAQISSSQGFGTYKFKIILPKNAPKLMISTNDLPSAASFWINGKLLESHGVPGRSKESTNPQAGPIFFELNNTGQQLDIIINVSGFFHKGAGLWSQLYIGESRTLKQQEIDDVARDSFVVSFILIMAIYHFILYFLRRDNNLALSLAIVLVFVLLKTLSSGNSLLLARYFDTPYLFVKYIEYASFICIPPAMLIFIHFVFPKDMTRRMIKYILPVPCLFLMVTLATPLNVYSYLAPPYQIYTVLLIIIGFYSLISAIIKHRHSSWLLILAFLAVAAGTVNDVTYAMGIHDLGYLVGYSIFFLVISQSAMLAKYFSMAFTKVEQSEKVITELNVDLKQHLDFVQQEIEEKTRDTKAILHNLSQGIFTISDHNGIFLIDSDYSPYLEDLLDRKELEGQNVYDTIFDRTNLSAESIADIRTVLISSFAAQEFQWNAIDYVLPSEFIINERVCEVGWDIITKNGIRVESFSGASKSDC